MSATSEAMPLLPGGEVIVDRLPAGAVVIDGLAPAVGDGLILVRDQEAAAVVLCRGGLVVGSYGVGAAPPVAELQSRPEATVSAWRVSPAALEAVPPLLAGHRLYDGLKLTWVDWDRLLDDLRGRGGDYVVTISTAAGSGVTRIRAGEHGVSYSESHPEPGDLSVLDELAACGDGSITVVTEPETGSSAASPPLEVVSLSVLRDGNGGGHEGEVADLAPQLKLLVRNRLELSAPRLEEVIERAAARNASLSALADDVRNTSIRGVMPSTLQQLASEMLALGRQR